MEMELQRLEQGLGPTTLNSQDSANLECMLSKCMIRRCKFLQKLI